MTLTIVESYIFDNIDKLLVMEGLCWFLELSRAHFLFFFEF